MAAIANPPANSAANAAPSYYDQMKLHTQDEIDTYSNFMGVTGSQEHREAISHVVFSRLQDKQAVEKCKQLFKINDTQFKNVFSILVNTEQEMYWYCDQLHKKTRELINQVYEYNTEYTREIVARGVYFQYRNMPYSMKSLASNFLPKNHSGDPTQRINTLINHFVRIEREMRSAEVFPPNSKFKQLHPDVQAEITRYCKTVKASTLESMGCAVWNYTQNKKDPQVDGYCKAILGPTFQSLIQNWGLVQFNKSWFVAK